MSNQRFDSKHTDRARRRLLQSLAAGGGAWASRSVLPEQWQRPVVDALTLPAHAQTTEQEVMNGTTTVEIEVPVAQANPVLDALVPEALAVPAPVVIVTFECCCNVTPDGDGYHADCSFKPTFNVDDDITQDADNFNEDCILLGSGHVDNQFSSIHIHCGDNGPFDFALRIEDGLGQFGIRFNGVDHLSSPFPILPGFKDLHSGECCKLGQP